MAPLVQESLTSLGRSRSFNDRPTCMNAAERGHTHPGTLSRTYVASTNVHATPSYGFRAQRSPTTL